MSTVRSPARPDDRLGTLAGAARDKTARAQGHLQAGNARAAALMLDEVLLAEPHHPEVLRLRALAFLHEGRAVPAIDCLQRALSGRERDALIACQLGAAFAQAGDMPQAVAWLRTSTGWDPQLVDAWYNLGLALDACDDACAACDAFARVIEIAPQHGAARIRHAQMLTTLGRLAEAESGFRGVLQDNAGSVAAWVGLANLKSYRADDAELDTLLHLQARADLPAAQRISLQFACASLLEARERLPEAFAMYVAANAARRRLVRWDSAAVSRLVSDVLAAFDGAEPIETESARGDEAIFIVGMPRSGSTLVEQILSAHPQVAGGGERGEVARLLQEESHRRGRAFPHWVGEATPADWARLGRSYLDRCAAWRGERPRFTDKTLSNWQTIGAIRRMLPGARFVHCRRDALEMLWSCFKQSFDDGQDFSYDFDDLVAFWRDCERAMHCWQARSGQVILEHEHEALLREPERRIRNLLAHCRLPFDPACLAPHENARVVRTASNAQVREPLRPAAATAARLGALLEPLRERITGRVGT